MDCTEVMAKPRLYSYSQLKQKMSSEFLSTGKKRERHNEGRVLEGKTLKLSICVPKMTQIDYLFGSSNAKNIGKF